MKASKFYVHIDLNIYKKYFNMTSTCISASEPPRNDIISSTSSTYLRHLQQNNGAWILSLLLHLQFQRATSLDRLGTWRSHLSFVRTIYPHPRSNRIHNCNILESNGYENIAVRHLCEANQSWLPLSVIFNI